ncbi:MAG: hypothetical protein GTO22_14555 [Gemmatimonadales bacterium]|nr:hypothetical protein [Gemmatimonadales bacterium]
MRNCDGENTEIGEGLYFDFEPSLRRCPWSILDAKAVAWFRKWERWTDLGELPYGSRELADEPYKVSQAFAACARANRYMDRRAERAKDAELQRLVALMGRTGGS